MAKTITHDCGICGAHHDLSPDAFTLCYDGAGKLPWMVWRCPDCDNLRNLDLNQATPVLQANVIAMVQRRLNIDPRPAAGMLELDSIIDVDVAWEAMSALYRSKLA